MGKLHGFFRGCLPWLVLTLGCGGGGGVGQAPIPADLPPSSAEASRFLTQATFGPVDADLQRVSAIGYSAWLDQQMAMPPPPRWTSTRPRWAAGWARLLRTCRRSSRI